MGPKEVIISTSQFSEELYQEPERAKTSSKIPQPAIEKTVSPIPITPVSQKEAELTSPIGIVPTPADILQEPKEVKGDLQTFGTDLYIKGCLEETSKIDHQLENIS